jgi:PAS domain S-box-containing protein
MASVMTERELHNLSCEECFELLARLGHTALVTTDAAGALREVSADARKLLAMEADPRPGAWLGELFEVSTRAALKAALTSLPQAPVLERVRPLGFPEDVAYRLEGQALRGAEGQVTGYVWVITAVPVKSELDSLADEARFRKMVGAVKDYAIFMLDPTGRVATWNAGAQEIKGYTEDEIVGSHIRRFYRPEDAAAGIPEGLLETARRQGRGEHEGWRVRKDGTLFWADVVITAIREGDEVVGFTKVTRDLSGRREAEEKLRQSEERFRLLVSSVKDYAIFMLDPEGRVTTWNDGAREIKGYSEKEILGAPFTRFYPPEAVESGEAHRLLEQARKEGRAEDEGWRVRKDGSRFWASVILSAVHDSSGKLIGFTKITRDLTDQRRLEAERVRAAQAEESIRMRDEFLSIASHELKTPLTSLQLQVDSLSEKAATADPRLKLRLQRARRSSQRLTELIESLLDVSRIATGRFELKPQKLDLAELAHEVVDRLAEAAALAECTLTLETEAPLWGEWDRLRLDQLLMNLLSNALKYAAGTPVLVRLRALEGERVELEVTDQGPGIPEDSLTRIFERFERASSMRNYGGLGLGLYVNQQIATAHGGTIDGRNLPGGGAAFRVVLPRKVPPTASSPAPGLFPLPSGAEA